MPRRVMARSSGRTIRPVLLTVMAMLLMTACATAPPQRASEQQQDPNRAMVRGTVAYPEDAVLPRDAELVVELRDISMQDAPAPLVGWARVTPLEEHPIPFRILYDRRLLNVHHSYALSARIRWNEQLLYVSDTSVPVITGGNPAEAKLEVRPVRR